MMRQSLSFRIEYNYNTSHRNTNERTHVSPNAKPTCNIIFFFLFLTVSFAVSDQKPTAYDAVKSYNLPPGILPKGVVDYELNTQTGDFKVYFNDTCEFTIQSYKLKYKSTISGVISPGHVKNLKGVSVKVLFFWVNIVEVSLDGADLEFSVGIASANFPAADFVESPQCGCGFDCNGLLFSS